MECFLHILSNTYSRGSIDEIRMEIRILRSPENSAPRLQLCINKLQSMLRMFCCSFACRCCFLQKPNINSNDTDSLQLAHVNRFFKSSSSSIVLAEK